MPALHEQNYDCTCLRSHVTSLRLASAAAKDIFSFNLKDVLLRMLANDRNRKFQGVGFAEFRAAYMTASNELATQKMEAQGFQPQDIAETIAHRICGGCGFHAFRFLKDNPEVFTDLLEAA